MKRKIMAIFSTIIFAGALFSAGVLTTGCGVLTNALGMLALNLLGVTPANDFLDTGNINFSLLGQSSENKVNLSGLAGSGLNVEVENEDGTRSDCEFVDEDNRIGSAYNSIAVVIDDSGSMENSYPQNEFGDMCLTCPHDPDQARYEAAGKLIERVLAEAPSSRIALMDFGPEADSGYDATRVLADFGSNMEDFVAAIENVDGSARVGTPMWDSLSEIVSALDDEAEDFEGELMSQQLPTTLGNDSDDRSVSVTRFIVVLGDGDDAAEFGGSDDFSLDDVISLAKSHDVVIHAIGLGPASATNENPMVKADEQLVTVTNLQRLAEETGGYYASANNPEELVALYDYIAMSMTQGYTVDTFNCQPREDGDDLEGEIPESGEPVEGVVSFGSFSLPWRIFAP